MLQQQTISKIALLASMAGIATLFLLAENIEAKEVSIREIDEGMLDMHVLVKGQVMSSYQTNKTAIMELYDGTGKVKAVMFRPSKEQLVLLGKGSFASFEGKVQIYKEELEIVVERVEEWR